MRLKVCGMTMIDQILALESMGIDFTGLIFYPRSPRYVLKAGLTAEKIKRERLQINKVGVFVNEPEEELLRVVDEWRLDMVQLHGDESPRYCERISNHVNTIKAFRIGKDENVAYKVYPYADAVDMYLFDTLGVQYGGTGEQFDWQLLQDAKLRKPYFLSGGIGISDAPKAIAFSKVEQYLFALDVNSKFEVSPGVKDMNLIKDFLSHLKSKENGS
jgi:phosphoribosylanthranilate isomerase